MYEFLYKISDTVGIIGVVFLLIAYFALNIGKIKSTGMTYQILNFTAAWLILYSLYFHWNTPSVIIEIFWIAISVVGMLRIILKKV